MQSPGSGVNRWLAWFHRWAGVALCVLFALWFASGAILHFVGFPVLTAADRHAGSETIDPSRLRLDPGEALARVPGAIDLRLISVAGRPVYLVQPAIGTWTGITGDSGEWLPPISAATARLLAERFGKYPATGSVGPIDYDQWIVHQHFNPFRPFYRVRLADGAGTEVYVSARTGEVLQRTTLRQRVWNYGGAVLHWVYFTPLRRSWPVWNQLVWWISLVAVLTSVAGTWLGIFRMVAHRAAGRRGLSPFRGWMRWHHIVGLSASVILLTWMTSGWLSMDHGRLFSHSDATPDQSLRMSGLSMNAIGGALPLAQVRGLPPVTEITFNAVGGRAFLTTYDAAGVAAVFLPDRSSSQPLARLPPALLLSGIEHVWPGRVRPTPLSDGDDPMYRLAESGVGAASFTVDGAPSLRVYVDPYSGRLLAVMDASRRTYAWVYYALHTWQFPGLIEHPALRTFLVLLSLTLGFGASVTGVVLSAKRLRRSFAGGSFGHVDG